MDASLVLDKETITSGLPVEPVFTRILDRSRDNPGRSTGYELKKNTTVEANGASP